MESVLSYFGETLFSNKKIEFEKIIKLFRIYTNDFRFENWALGSNYSFYNENMFVTMSKSLSHFFVNDKSSFVKISRINNIDFPNASSTVVDYAGQTSSLEFERWYEFSNGKPNPSDYMQDKEYPIKMLANNLTPFYLLRERFMSNYSYSISNVDSFPTIRNFSNFMGDEFSKRVDFVAEFLKKAETTFRKVKKTYKKDDLENISSTEFRRRYHRTSLRLVTLRGLNILNPNQTFRDNRLLYSGLMEYKERSQKIIKKLLKEVMLNEENSEYLSRQ